jgi:sugar phosphate permease
MTTTQTNPRGSASERLMALVWRKPAATIAERTRRRVYLHLIPYLFFLYILAYLDRVNVSVAGLKMQLPPGEGGMGFDQAIIGFGAGMFFKGYWILEVPSTVSVVRWGARWVFVRILILWGICAALAGAIGTPFADSLFAWLPHIPEQGGWVGALDGLLGWQVFARIAGFVNGLDHKPAYQFYFFRFMLGFFEGGFFPSVIVYLSHWFRTQDRAKAIAGFMSAIPLSSMLGVPFSGWLMEHVGWLGLPGWRWIFILQGVAPVLAGFATLFFLPDRPAKARWLPAEERDWLNAELEREHKSKKSHSHWVWVHHLGMVLLLTGVYFCLNVTSYGLSMFLPALIKSQSGVSDQAATYLASLVYLMGFLAILVNGRHSDRTGERIWHVAVPLALYSLGLWLAAGLDGVPVIPVVVMIVCVGTFMYAHLPAFWPIPTMFLGATAAASAIGFINMIGNLGGAVGPEQVGKAVAYKPAPAAVAGAVGLLGSTAGEGPLLATSFWEAERVEQKVSFAPALRILAPWPLVAATIILIVGYARRKARPPAV